MKKNLLLVAVLMFSNYLGFAQQSESYDYSESNRKMIQYGVQAILTCNGLFTSNRTLEQVYDQELKYLKQPIGNAQGGNYLIDWDRKQLPSVLQKMLR